MSDAIKLDSGQKHFLRLIVKGANDDGWAKVSKPVFQLMEKMPSALVELERIGDDGGGRVRLTPQGLGIIDAMAWL